jgi:cell division protein FtsB
MKRYYNNDNMEQDPSRSIMPIREMAMNNPFINNNQSQRINPDTNNQSQSQRFNSDIDIKYITSSKDLLPKNNMTNSNNIDTITSFNNGMTRLKDLTDELFEKNKSLQEHKNREFKLEEQIKELKSEVGNSNKNQMEIIAITQRNTELMNEIHKLQSQKGTDDKIIERLERALVNLKDNKNNDDDDDDETIYDNKELRELLKKYKKLDDKIIDHLFSKFKITEELEVTKELLLKLM